MSVISKASLVLIPSGYGEDVLYSEVPNTTAGDFTFTRASTGTRVNADGYIEEVPWNLVTYSESFGSGTFFNSTINLTVINNNAVAPNGTTTAAKLTSTADGARLGTSNYVPSILSPSTTYTFSVYVKNINAANYYVRTVSATPSNNVEYTISTTEWTRIEHTFTTGASATYIRLVSDLAVGESILVWGAQVVKGTSAKPYIKTTDRLNIPRLDYSGGASCPTLLLEGQRTNLVTYSEDLNSNTKLNVVVTSDDIISPRGTQDADKLETTSNNSYKLLKTNSVSFVSGSDYTFSFYAKKGTTDFIQLITTNTLFGATSEWANFDLNNGIVSLDNYGGASIEDVGNGWYRCKMTSTCVSSGTDGWFVSVITSGTSTRAEYTTSVVDVYVWGLQVEQGSFPTSYIPTSGTSVTRTIESFEADNLSTIIGQTEGCIFIDFVYYEGNRFEIFDATSTADGFLIYRSGTTYNLQVGNGGTYWAITNFITGLTIGTRYKLAINYKLNDYKVYVNGSQTATNTSIEVPTTNKIISSQSNGANKFTNNINKFAMFDAKLTDSELEELTTI